MMRIIARCHYERTAEAFLTDCLLLDFLPINPEGCNVAMSHARRRPGPDFLKALTEAKQA